MFAAASTHLHAEPQTTKLGGKLCRTSNKETASIHVDAMCFILTTHTGNRSAIADANLPNNKTSLDSAPTDFILAIVLQLVSMYACTDVVYDQVPARCF